jgi:alanyl-tRNA synthetase
MNTDVIKKYENFCKTKGITFQINDNVKPYDNTTLFCPAGMQQFKHFFKDTTHQDTISNIQSCIRMNDIDEIGDGSHLLYFNMVGFFSFRDKTVKEVIDFWMEFLEKELGLKISYVTIHPDKIEEWEKYYNGYDVEIKNDEECKWSDGEIGGYCTEFYIDGIEIGNIVNPLGNCIDVGFGLERLQYFVNGKVIKTKEETLKETILKIMALI